MFCFRSFLSAFAFLLLLVICLVAISPGSAYASHLRSRGGCSAAAGSGCSGGAAAQGRAKIFTKKLFTKKARSTGHSTAPVAASAPATAASTAKPVSAACVGGVCQMLSAVLGLPGTTGITHTGDYRPVRFGN